MAQEAALKEVANSKLRSLLAYNQSFICADVKIGDTSLLRKSTNKKSAPRRRGPAQVLDIDETGATVKFQPQTFCVQEKVEGKDVDVEESDPLHARMWAVGSAPSEQLMQRDMGGGMDAGGGEGNRTSGSSAPGSGDGYHPATIPAPNSPTLSEKLPPSPRSPVRHPEWKSSFDKESEPRQAPGVDWARYDQLAWDQRALRWKESEGVLKTRLARWTPRMRSGN